MNSSDAEINQLAQEASDYFKQSTSLNQRAAQLSQQAEWAFKTGKKQDGSKLLAESRHLMSEADEMYATGQRLLAQAKQLKSEASGGESSENGDTENTAESVQLSVPRQDKQTDLYRFGIDTIIGGTIQFAAPFHLLSKRVLDQTIFNGNIQSYSTDSCKMDVDLFLQKFSIFTEGYVQIISERYAETIRRSTLLPEIRGKTTMSLAKQIREECFGDIDLALRHFALVAADLGISLATTSTTRGAVSGALVGGGLDFLLTDGDDSLIGTLAGAFIGGALAESNKRNLRSAMYDSAVVSVKSITTLVSATPHKLMDAYVCNIFGGQTDFGKRDKEIQYGREITSEIIGACTTIFGLIMDLRRKLEVQRLLKKGGQDEELIGKLYSWHKYIEQLQDSCTAGIMEEARVS